VVVVLTLAATAALATTGTAAAASDQARRGDRIERVRQGCVRELDKLRDRAILRFGDRVAGSEWLTDDHVAALTTKIGDLSAAVDDTIAAVEAATSRRALRIACDPRPLRRRFHLVRFQVRAVGAADQVDSVRAALQTELDDLAAALTSAEVVDADLLVADVQALLDNVDMTGVADSILALDPAQGLDELHGAMDDIREEIETAFAELDGVATALADLATLLDAPDGESEPGDN